MKMANRRENKMTTETALPTITIAEPTGHAHHWVIGEPEGPVSRGVCKTCGAARDFRNWLEEIDFITTDEERRAA